MCGSRGGRPGLPSLISLRFCGRKATLQQHDTTQSDGSKQGEGRRWYSNLPLIDSYNFLWPPAFPTVKTTGWAYPCRRQWPRCCEGGVGGGWGWKGFPVKTTVTSVLWGRGWRGVGVEGLSREDNSDLGVVKEGLGEGWKGFPVKTTVTSVLWGRGWQGVEVEGLSHVDNSDLGVVKEGLAGGGVGGGGGWKALTRVDDSDLRVLMGGWVSEGGLTRVDDSDLGIVRGRGMGGGVLPV